MTLLEFVKFVDYNYCKGLQYEKFVADQLWKYFDLKEVYLWKYVPYSLLIESNIIIPGITHKNKKIRQVRNYNMLIDTGIDIICKLNNGNIILVQCKAYNNSVVSQKHLAGFYRTLLDSILYNKNNNKKYQITGLIVHTTSVSDIITSSYCYNKEIVRDLYIPYEYEDNRVPNKLKKYNDITIMINMLFFIINIGLFLMN